MITDEMVEVAAERIFRHWMFQPKDRLPVKWTPDGNSEKQAEARLYAIAALEAVLPMIRAEVLEEAAKVADARELRWLEDAEQSSSGSAERIFRRKADAAVLIAFAIRAMKGVTHDA